MILQKLQFWFDAVEVGIGTIGFPFVLTPFRKD